MATLEKNIFSWKIKRKNIKKYNIPKKNITWDNFSFDKNEKIKKLALEISKKNKEIDNKLINLKSNSINNNDNLFFPTLKSKSSNKSKSIINSYTNEEKNLFSDKINKLIPKIAFLSKKLMINEYSVNKNKNKLKNSKNMTQLNFLLHDYFFTERGNKIYSTEPLLSGV